MMISSKPSLDLSLAKPVWNATIWFSLFFVMISGATMAQTTESGNRLTPESILDLKRVGEFAISPDGRYAAYTVSTVDLEDNSSSVSLMLLELPSKLGPSDKKAVGFETPMIGIDEPKKLMEGVSGLNSINWFGEGDALSLLYLAPGTQTEWPDDADHDHANHKHGHEHEHADHHHHAHDDHAHDDHAHDDHAHDDHAHDDDEGPSGPPQIWAMNIASGETKELTSWEDGVSNLKLSPTGDYVAFTRDVKLDETVTELYEDLPKADARIINSLMYRHWNQWHDYKYSHVHVATLSEDLQIGEPRDLMPEMTVDCPLPPFGGSEHFNFSPNGKEIALTIKISDNPAMSTDSAIYLTSVAEASALKNITPNMPGYDREPRYSPDGRYIAFDSMERAGFESDRNRIFLYDRENEDLQELTVGLDQMAHNATWGENSDRLYFDSEYAGTQQVFEISLEGRETKQLSSGQFDFHVKSIIPGQNAVIVTQSSMIRPNEFAVVDTSGATVATLTSENEEMMASLELPTVSERWVDATDGESIHNWVILPPDFDETKQYPLLVYCQGGPQGQIGQWFSYRWNFHLMASQGYVVIAVNRRGLPGFGQAWNDQISGDWGGQAMQDILSATDSMLGESYIDTDRVGAVGASFGGYTVYWLMGNSGERFSAMIAHCGVFNLESMYGSTEELFFVNWDLDGAYWSSESTQKKYNQFSPHKYIGNWKTPLLVIHGEKDFRVPVTQGMEAFTAAQLQGVPSRFLYFPEEGHWVGKPQNGVLWARVFFQWLEEHIGE